MRLRRRNNGTRPPQKTTVCHSYTNRRHDSSKRSEWLGQGFFGLARGSLSKCVVSTKSRNRRHGSSKRCKWSGYGLGFWPGVVCPNVLLFQLTCTIAVMAVQNDVNGWDMVFLAQGSLSECVVSTNMHVSACSCKSRESLRDNAAIPCWTNKHKPIELLQSYKLANPDGLNPIVSLSKPELRLFKVPV